MHCCSFSAGRTEEISVLLVTGCVQVGRALGGCRQGGGARRVGKGLHARHAHLHTDSGSGDACRNPCAGIRVQESAGICTNGHVFMTIEVASLSFSSS